MHHILQVASCQIHQRLGFLANLSSWWEDEKNRTLRFLEEDNPANLISSRPLSLEYRPVQPRQYPHLQPCGEQML